MNRPMADLEIMCIQHRNIIKGDHVFKPACLILLRLSQPFMYSDTKTTPHLVLCPGYC